MSVAIASVLKDGAQDVIVTDAIRYRSVSFTKWKPALRVNGGLLITSEAFTYTAESAEISAYNYARAISVRKGHRFYGAEIRRLDGSGFNLRFSPRPVDLS